MKAKNNYVWGKPDFIERVAGEYEFLGLYVKRVPGGLMVPAMQPKAEKRDDGTWRWVFPKSRDEKKKPVQRGKRRDDEEKQKQDRSQKPKSR